MEIESTAQRGPSPAVNSDRDQELQEQVRTLTVLNNTYLKEIRELQQKNEYLNFKACSSTNIVGDKSQQAGIDLYLNSYAFRVGQTLVDAVRKPGKNTLLMPFRLVRLMFEIATKRKATRKS